MIMDDEKGTKMTPVIDNKVGIVSGNTRALTSKKIHENLELGSITRTILELKKIDSNTMLSKVYNFLKEKGHSDSDISRIQNEWENSEESKKMTNTLNGILDDAQRRLQKD